MRAQPLGHCGMQPRALTPPPAPRGAWALEAARDRSWNPGPRRVGRPREQVVFLVLPPEAL